MDHTAVQRARGSRRGHGESRVDGPTCQPRLSASGEATQRKKRSRPLLTNLALGAGARCSGTRQGGSNLSARHRERNLIPHLLVAPFARRWVDAAEGSLALWHCGGLQQGRLQTRQPQKVNPEQVAMRLQALSQHSLAHRGAPQNRSSCKGTGAQEPARPRSVHRPQIAVRSRISCASESEQ